jgi:hypothetical protein
MRPASQCPISNVQCPIPEGGCGGWAGAHSSAQRRTPGVCSLRADPYGATALTRARRRALRRAPTARVADRERCRRCPGPPRHPDGARWPAAASPKRAAPLSVCASPDARALSLASGASAWFGSPRTPPRKGYHQGPRRVSKVSRTRHQSPVRSALRHPGELQRCAGVRRPGELRRAGRKGSSLSSAAEQGLQTGSRSIARAPGRTGPPARRRSIERTLRVILTRHRPAAQLPLPWRRTR